jgi:hypothetical protein
MSSATPPFFTTDINNDFLRKYQPDMIPALSAGYVMLTLFEFLEKLDNRTTRWTSKQDESAHYQRVKQLNKENMRKYLAQYLCRGKIGVGYGMRAVERTLTSDYYDVLIIASPEINKDVIDDSGSEGSVTSNMDSQPPEQRLRELAAEAELPPVAVPGDYESDEPEVPGDYLDLEGMEDEEDSEEEDYQGRPGPAWRPEPKGRNNAAQIRNLKKQKDDSAEIRKIKLQSVMGFLIVQKGECSFRPNDYAVNLICVKDGAEPGTGQLLIGLYLYTILKRPPPVQLGLLELAGGYYNISGLCLYSKFGFVPNMDFSVSGCFDYPGNMPMILDFNRYNVQSIRDAKNIVCAIVAGDKYHQGFKLPICNVKKNQSVVVALREYNRLIDYIRPPPFPNIGFNSFDRFCSRHPDLDLINSQTGTAYESKIYTDVVPDLITVMETGGVLSPDQEEFVRIISSVAPNATGLKFKGFNNRYRQALMDYSALCAKMFKVPVINEAPVNETEKQNKDMERQKLSKQSKSKTAKQSKSKTAKQSKSKTAKQSKSKTAKQSKGKT